MTRDIENAVIAAVNTVSERKITALDRSARIEEMGLDSIGTTEVILKIEEQMGAELSEPALLAIADATSVGQFLSILDDFYRVP